MARRAISRRASAYSMMQAIPTGCCWFESTGLVIDYQDESPV